MYTPEMRRAFHSVLPPKKFYVDLIDNEFFVTIRIDEKLMFSLPHDDKLAAFEYVLKVKKALEAEGAIVHVVRKALDK
jgi:hypothetical protein